MIGQVAAHRRDGDKALIDRLKIGPALGPKSLPHLADPILQLAARVDMLADNRPSALKSLFGNTDSFGHAFWNVDVQ